MLVVRTIALIWIGALTVGASFPLQQDARVRIFEDDEIAYEPVPSNLFPGLEKAALIVDYNYSTGVSLGDRYQYEVIIADRTLHLAFDSKGTESYKRVLFQATRELTPAQVNNLAGVIRSASLVQRRDAIPRPKFSAHTREVLIVRSKQLTIGGGMFNSSIPESVSVREENSRIARERAETSTIGGNYDVVIKTLRGLFAQLDGLIAQAEGR